MIFERDLALHCVSSRKLLEASCNACAEFVGSAQETKTPPERAEQWSRFFATGRLEADFRYTFERKSLCGIGKSYVREEPREFARVLRLPIIVTATHDRRVVSQTDIVGLVWRIRGI